MPLNHAEAVASLRDDPTLASASREELEAEVSTLLGDDDPLAVALVIEEAQSLGPRAPPGPKRTGGEGCRLETDCGGREPVAGNGRCMTCGADRGEPVEVVNVCPTCKGDAASCACFVASDTEAPQAPEIVNLIPAHVPPRPTSGEPLTARVKDALGLTDSELGRLIGVSRPTANAYASGRLPEIIDSIRAEYLLRAIRKRADAMRGVEAELEAIIALGD